MGKEHTKQSSEELCLVTLSQDAHWNINKKIARCVGLNAALLLSDLLSKYQYFKIREELVFHDGKHGWFFNTSPNIERDTSLTRHQQAKAREKLIQTAFIMTDNFSPGQRDFQNRVYYWINFPSVAVFLTTGKTQSPVAKKVTNREIQTGEAATGANKEESGGTTKVPVAKKVTPNKNKDNKNKESGGSGGVFRRTLDPELTQVRSGAHEPAAEVMRTIPQPPPLKSLKWYQKRKSEKQCQQTLTALEKQKREILGL